MARLKQYRRITIHVTTEQYERWERWARRLDRSLPKFIAFLVDGSIRLFRERDRGRQYPEIDALGLRIQHRERFRKRLEEARDALDRLVWVIPE
jgi:hypothetical protein